MATLYSDAQGALLRFVRSDAEAQLLGPAPAGTTQTVTFDEETNAAVIAGLHTDWNSHRVVANTLQRNGVAVRLEPNGTAATERIDLDSLLLKLQAGTSLTTAETRRALLYALRVARRSMG